MNNYNFLKRVMRFSLISGLVIILINSVGCTESENENSQIPMSIASIPTPECLISVIPITISQEGYYKSLESTFTMARGIVVQIDGNKIGMTTENRNLLFFQQRASLVVDDQQVPQDTLRVADGLEGMGGPFYLSWAPELVPGVHEVQFRFMTDAGDILKYSWQIVIEK